MTRLFPLAAWVFSAAITGAGAQTPVTVAVDAAAARHPISPLIYGVAFASTADLKALGAPLNRSGGDNSSTYNWQVNAQNLDYSWYFESYPGSSHTAGGDPDAFVSRTKAAGAKSMLTLPLIGWVAKLSPTGGLLPSFSVKKYGAQCHTDPYYPDAGNGVRSNCSTHVTGNDPNDAYVPDSLAAEKPWITHLTSTWGGAAAGVLPYYLMDNEASIWYGTHFDIHPVGAHATEYRDDVIAASAMVKSVDPNALIVAPEEWGYEGYFYSGYDQQYAAAHNYNGVFPDRTSLMGGMDYVPWLLSQWKAAGHPVDVLSVHFYPQGAEFSNDVSTATQLLRNRSTRQLWDPSYKSESWIAAPVYLIPRLKAWVSSYYYAGTPVALTEYNWGAEGSINGATTQADIFGILGRESADMATRWTVPSAGSPTYKSMQMYRNYDGKGSAFGDVSVSATVPNPDNLSAFAAQRTSDSALTVMVINKVLSGTAKVNVTLANFTAAGTAKAWQLTSANAIKTLSPVAWSGGKLLVKVPAQSITLLVLPK